jgi:hypothetical protein
MTPFSLLFNVLFFSNEIESYLAKICCALLQYNDETSSNSKMQILQNFQCLIDEEYVKVQHNPPDLIVSSKRRQMSKRNNNTAPRRWVLGIK